MSWLRNNPILVACTVGSLFLAGCLQSNPIGDAAADHGGIACPDGRFVTGFNAAGEPICVTIDAVAPDVLAALASACPDGEFLRGFNDDGTPLCGEPPVAQGPAGPQGEQGPTGPPGPVGADGQDGAHGLSCWDTDGDGTGDPAEDVNADGDRDAADCQGPKGDTGDTGAAGAPGPQGEPGATGPEGPKGDTGAEGPAGADGRDTFWPRSTPHTFTAVDTDDAGSYNSIAIGSDKLPIISYVAIPEAGSPEQRVAHCDVPTCATYSIHTIDDTGNAGGGTSIAIGADGLPIITYYANGLAVVHCLDTACATSSRTTVAAGLGVGEYTSVAIGTDGLPVIGFQDTSDGAAKVALCEDVACSTAAIQTIEDDIADPTKLYGKYMSLTIGSDGNPVMSYEDSSSARLNVAYCHDPKCATNIHGFSDSTGGLFTSIAVGIDGFPVVSHYGLGELRIVHCTRLDCGQWDLATVATAADVGWYSSISIGADGFPFISHFDQDANDLLVTDCHSLTCSGSSTHTVHAEGSVGAHTSVTTGSDGLPIVAYWDLANEDLLVVHLGNPHGLPHWSPR